MDKPQFIQKAPYYYALAVAVFLRESPEEYATLSTVEGSYFERDYESADGSGYDYLESGATLDTAISLLKDLEMITVRKRDFGPPILRKSDLFEDKWVEFGRDEDLPFHDYQLLQTGNKVWLHRALREVNIEAQRLQISRQDYEEPELDWEPIALDRADLKLVEAKQALAAAIEELRGNNGYSATHPNERNFVLAELEEGARSLETEPTTTRSFVRRKLLDPLNIQISRGKKAALGLLAAAARQAILEWLVTHGKDLLTGLFN